MWKWEAEKARATVVLVHGAGEHHGRYQWVIEKFRNEGFHVITGDLPGQGTSSRRSGHIDSFSDYIEVIESWVEEALNNGLPVFLLGHSMGGLAVIRTMTEKTLPVQAVLLSSPCLEIVNRPSRGKDALTKVLSKIAPKFRFDSGLEPGGGTRNEEVRRIDREDLLLVRRVSVRWYRELVGAMKRAHEEVRQFPDLPVLVLQAGEDYIVDKTAVQKWFNALEIMEKTYKEWPELYHEVLNEPERESVFLYLKKYIELQLR
jgi:lysophospholipase